MAEVWRLQGWGQTQNTFEQAPPPGAEWGRANNVVPGQEPAAPAGVLVWQHLLSCIFTHMQKPDSSSPRLKGLSHTSICGNIPTSCHMNVYKMALCQIHAAHVIRMLSCIHLCHGMSVKQSAPTQSRLHVCITSLIWSKTWCADQGEQCRREVAICDRQSRAVVEQHSKQAKSQGARLQAEG